MALAIDAVYENGVLKPCGPLPLQEGQKVKVTIHPSAGTRPRRSARMQWTGSVEELDYLILSEENDPMEAP